MVAPPSVISFDDAVERARAALDAGPRRRIAAAEFRPAAVLVPILNRPGGPTVLFTLRTDSVRDHQGQISFPGGGAEAGEDARAAALREAREEIGLDPACVATLGLLDDVLSVSSYVVTPVVGAVADPPATFLRQESEVLEPFEVPLARLLDRAYFRSEWWEASRLPPGAPVERLLGERGLEETDAALQRYKVHFFEPEPGPRRRIWGLTARILKTLLDRAFGFAEADQRP